VLNNACVQGGDIWVIIPPTGSVAIGIRDAIELPRGGNITAWAPTRDQAIGIQTQKFPNTGEIDPYKFDDFRGIHYHGNAILYPNEESWTIRRVYETTSYIIITPEVTKGALIAPDKETHVLRDRRTLVPISFDSFPGYELTSLFINHHDMSDRIPDGYTLLRAIILVTGITS